MSCGGHNSHNDTHVTNQPCGHICVPPNAVWQTAMYSAKPQHKQCNMHLFSVHSNCANSVHTISQAKKLFRENKSTVPYLKHDLSCYHLVCSGPLKTCGPSDVVVLELYHTAIHTAYY